MNKKIIGILAMIGFACSLGAIASCEDGSAKSSQSELKFNVSADMEHEAGEYINIPSADCVAPSGKRLFPKVKVVDAENNELIIDSGKVFLAGIGAYTVSYTLIYENETIVKSFTINAVDSQTPEISVEKEIYYTQEGGDFDLNNIVYFVSDNITAKEKLQTTITVSRNREPVELTENKISAVNGTYEVLIKAVDESDNAGEKTVKVKSYEVEEGVVQYFHRDFGTEGIKTRFSDCVSSFAIDTTIKHGTDEGSLKFTSTKGYFGLAGVQLTAPYITDISSYKYFYFYVYTEMGGAKLVSFNDQYGTGQELEAGKWTLCTVYKRNDGKFTNNSSDYYTVFPTENNAYAPTDITNAYINFSWTEGEGTFYISPIRVATELPAVEIPDRVFAGEEFTVPTATMSDTTGVTQKVYIDNTLIEGATATIADEGAHDIQILVFKNGRLIYEINKKIVAFLKEAGVVQYFHKDFGTEGIKTRFSDCVSSFAIDTTIKHGTDEGSLKFTSTKGYWNLAGITLKAPYITDISSYKYFYFYVYTETEGAKFESINNIGWTGTKTLEAGKWTLIKLVRPDGYTDYWGGDGNHVYIPDVKSGDTVATTDITNLYFNFSWTEGEGTFYISPIRVSDTAPGA